MPGWSSKKWFTVLLHIAAWVLLFSLPFILRPSMSRPAEQDQHATQALIRYIINDLIYVSYFYLNASAFIPKLFYKRKYKEFGLANTLSFVIIVVITWLSLFQLMKESNFNLSGHILFNVFFFLFFLAASTAYRMIRDRAKADRIAREKETENLKTELSLLRSQASPHFMFNVLNNMVAMARKKSELLEPSLLKFSSLMRYMLYEADEEKVLLEKEIEYLHSYIDLQQQRFGKNVQVNADLDKVDGNYEIEPMLLIPFVENAFKHGTGFVSVTKVDGSDLVVYNVAEINIELTAQNGVLNFTVKNRYNESAPETKDNTSGIGLTNVKRRLNLLYGDKHKLSITKRDGWFMTSLQLKLK